MIYSDSKIFKSREVKAEDNIVNELELRGWWWYSECCLMEEASGLEMGIPVLWDKPKCFAILKLNCKPVWPT